MPRMLAVATLLVVGGCDQLFSRTPPTTDDLVDAMGRDDANTDAAPTADAPTADAPLLDALSADAAAACPAGYAALETGVYRFVTVSASWEAAALDCANDSAPGALATHLVVIGSEPERSRVQAASPFVEPWIGLSARAGTMQWVTAEPAPVARSGAPWGSEQPDGDGACVYTKTADLYDGPCTEPRVYTCECDAYADDPARY